MSIRLGRIPYLNSEVFYQDFPLDLVELVEYVPAAMARAARRGEVDVGPLPLVTCFELEDEFEPLRDFGIAVNGKARSVLLFSKAPIEGLDGKRIAVTGESATSVRLLKVLLNRRYGVRPSQYVSTKDLKSDAVLLIGDAALNNRGGLPSYPKVYDLAELWHEWTGLPFVFARWIVRRDLNPEAIEFLGDLLEDSLKSGLEQIEEIALARTDLSMKVDEVREYLEGFTYIMGRPEKRSISVFRKYLEEEEQAAAAERRAVGKAPNAG